MPNYHLYPALSRFSTGRYALRRRDPLLRAPRPLTSRAAVRNGLPARCTCPWWAAGTANTEFEILTGMDLDFFGAGEYPYYTVPAGDALRDHLLCPQPPGLHLHRRARLHGDLLRSQ